MTAALEHPLELHRREPRRAEQEAERAQSLKAGEKRVLDGRQGREPCAGCLYAHRRVGPRRRNRRRHAIRAARGWWQTGRQQRGRRLDQRHGIARTSGKHPLEFPFGHDH